ncbi:MAG: hypothetical protein IJZ42_09210 [Lachnospiraceae bacterium]|nr:hypothetical protein [Lachnospiraceae bacterium]
MRIIRMNKRRKKIIVFIIASALIIASVLIAIFLNSCNPYDRVTQKDEKTVLFIIAEGQNPMSDYEKNRFLCVDNNGDIYELYPQNMLDEAIENGEIWEGDILGKVPADEAINYYHKLCKIDEELFFYHRESGGTGMEVYDFYFGVRYIDGEAEILRIGHDESYTENKYAESIVEWMKEWEYE